LSTIRGAVFSLYKSKNDLTWIGSQNNLAGFNHQTDQIIFTLNLNLPVRLIIEDDEFASISEQNLKIK
jgi:hypothetical protein